MGKGRVVIIGSGLGGLVCGAILSRYGYPVTLLEQHHTVGGCLQSFVRGGVKFDTGMHYIGSMGKGEILRRLWDFLGLTPEIELQQLDPQGFDRIDIAGRQYCFASGYEQFIAKLAKDFPHQASNIAEYARSIRRIAGNSLFYSENTSPQSLIDNSDLNLSIDQFLDRTIDDEQLKNVLIGNILLFAGEKGKTPIYLDALINNSYIEGAYRVVGGSDKIAKVLARNISHTDNCHVITEARVEHIDCHDGAVAQVVLADGRMVQADYVISDIHPKATIDMIDGKIMRKNYRERIGAAENTTSVFTLYLHFKEDTVPYQNYNHYRYDSPDVWSSIDCRGEQFANSYLYMHQCEHPGQQFARSAIVMTYMDYEEVQQWAGTEVGRRGEAYKQFKNSHTQLLLDKLERDFPGISAHIEACYASTPLTYENYTSTPRGSLYGTAMDAHSPLGGVIAHWTKVRNLYFTGQNTYAHGMLGVAIGAVITCGEFVNLTELVHNIKNKYQCDF